MAELTPSSSSGDAPRPNVTQECGCDGGFYCQLALEGAASLGFGKDHSGETVSDVFIPCKVRLGPETC